MPVRSLRPLRDGEAEQLIRGRHPDLDDQRRGWVVEQAEGNPLALAELPLAASAGQLGTDASIPLTDRLKRSFAARVSGLSGPARSAVVVAAAADSDDFAETAAAVTLAVPDAGPDLLRPAVEAGILTITQATLTFEHPLMR